MMNINDKIFRLKMYKLDSVQLT